MKGTHFDTPSQQLEELLRNSECWATGLSGLRHSAIFLDTAKLGFLKWEYPKSSIFSRFSIVNHPVLEPPSDVSQLFEAKVDDTFTCLSSAAGRKDL